MKTFFLRWFCTTLAVGVAVHLTGMHAEGFASLLAVALVIGVINAFVRPVLLLLSLPFILVTLGFFILIVNAVILWIAGTIVPGFYVGGFGNAFFGALIVSIVSWALSGFFREPAPGLEAAEPEAQPEPGMKQVHGRVIESARVKDR